jgi:hypothetical protein
MTIEERAQGYTAVVRGAFRGFGVLLVGGLFEPVPDRLLGVAAVAWLPLVAVAAFAVAGLTAMPAGTPAAAWRNAPVAAVLSYGLILPLVQMGAGRIPVVQLVTTTVTALLVGAVVGLVRALQTGHEARSRPVVGDLS